MINWEEHKCHKQRGWVYHNSNTMLIVDIWWSLDFRIGPSLRTEWKVLGFIELLNSSHRGSAEAFQSFYIKPPWILSEPSDSQK